MPFPNEHACRLNQPNYPKYARKNCAVKHGGKCIDFIYGIRGPGQSELQSMRYAKNTWDAADARAHCKSKKGSFEAASGRTTMDIYLKSDGQYVKKELSQDEYLGWFKSNIDDEGNVTEDCLLYKDANLTVNTDKSVTFVMSDDSLDRDFERFDSSGWDLKPFKKNPVLLWGHDRSRPAIGLVEKTRVKETRLLGNPTFDEDDPFAMAVSKKVDKRIIRSGSVGFFPTKIEFNDDEKDPCRLTYLKQELREFSLCNVPANPNALAIEPGKSDAIKKALKEVPAYVNNRKGHELEPKKPNDSPQIDTAVISVVEWEEIKDKLEMLGIEVETIKTMQMKMAETVVKDDKNYYAELLNTKKPQSRDLRTFLKQRRGK